MPPAILNVVLGNGGDSYSALKEETFYGDYEGEIAAVGGNLAGPSSIMRIKDEPVSIRTI